MTPRADERDAAAEEAVPPDDDALDAWLDEAPEEDGDDAEDVADASATPDRLACPAADDARLAALVGRVIYQDEAAFAELYRALAGRVFGLASRLVRDPGLAEEVVEEVFWQVWRQAPRFDPARGNVLAWVLRIARSRAIDALRAVGRSPLHQAVEWDAEAGHDTLGDEGPEHRLSDAQQARRLEAALAVLDPLRRQLVSLAFLRGYSQAEIAEQTGLPLGTVKSHIRRALVAMKSRLETDNVALPGAGAQ